MENIANTFNQAVRHHQTGNVRQAEQLYQQILQTDPRHADSHSLLGVCAYQAGRHDEAATSIQRAISLNPNVVGYHCNLGLVYQAQGKTKDAVACYQKVLTIQPDSAEAHCVLGNLLRVLGRLDEAVAHCRQALQVQPYFAGAYNNLGLALAEKGDAEGAVAQYRVALSLDPNYVAAHSNLGMALAALDKFNEAEVHYRQALRLDPRMPEAYNGLGNVLRCQGKAEEAIPQIREALRLRPNYAEAHNNLANALFGLGQKSEAESHYQQALRLRPDYAEARNNLGALFIETQPTEAERHCREAIRLRPQLPDGHNNLGNALLRLGKLDEALACFREAVRLRPSFAEALNNLGTAIKDRGEVDQGLATLEQALRLKPNYAEARWNRALVWLLQGDLERGWPEYEWRWQRPGFTWRNLPQPRWDGTPLAGRTILLWAEQGLGDTIQFVRYASLIKERGGKVIFESQAPLMRLLAGAKGIDQLIARGSTLPPFDVQAPLLSLPGIMRTSLKNIPATVPYLQADAKLEEKWRKGLSAIDGFKVGIAWQGNPEYIADRQRSVPLKHFERLAAIKGVKLLSLQKGPGVEQLADFAPAGSKRGKSILDLGTKLDQAAGPFMDTAAIIKNLDLVVSSDTAIVHLAGALGVPVWVALPLIPDWRWQLQREDSPWYPTMRLFRQSRFGAWEDVFERLAAELAKLAGK